MGMPAQVRVVGVNAPVSGIEGESEQAALGTFRDTSAKVEHQVWILDAILNSPHFATEAGHATLDEVLPTPASVGYRLGRRLIRDSHYYENATWRTVLVKSLNSGMVMISQRMKHAEMQEIVRRFGFGRPTGCGLPGETGGIVTPPGRWSNTTQASVAFGHEIAVTPLQMARAFCAFATGTSFTAVTVTVKVCVVVALSPVVPRSPSKPASVRVTVTTAVPLCSATGV